MKVKRFFAMLLAMCMMLSAINIQALASVESPTTAEQDYLVENFTARPKISLIYMEPGDPEDGTGFQYKKTTKPTSFSVGQKIYVGVKYDNFKQYKTVGTDGNGLYSFSASLLFDKNVLVPEPTFLETNEVDPLNADWESVINDAGGASTFADDWKQRIDVEGSYFHKSGLKLGQEFATYMFKNPNEGLDGGISNVKVMGMATNLTSATAKPHWGEDSFITAIYEFVVKSVPEPGTKVLDFYRAPTDLTISFGVGGAATDYKYGNKQVNDLAGFTDLDISAVDLFPMQYTVGFYNSYDADTSSYGTVVGDKITVNDGSSVSSVVESTKDTENPVTVPTEAEFTAPEGKFYNGLKYLDKNGNEQNFDPEMTINSEVFAESVTELKVYADWVDGNKITFNSNYGDNKPSGVTEEKTKIVTIAPTATTIEETNSDIPKTSGESADFPAPNGYTFGGWYQDEACNNKVTFGEGGTTFSDGDEVFAKWIENVEIVYDDNGGTGGPGTVSNTPTTVYTDPTEPTREKYDFAGWNTKSNGAGTKVQADATKTFADVVATDGNAGSSITLYAQWTPKADEETVTLTFDTVGGDAAKPSTITVVKGDAITAAQMPDTPTKKSATSDPYTFLGWFKDASLTNTDEITAPITLEENTTAYAHWSYDGKDQVKITFNDNGATTAVTPTEITIGKGDSIGAAMPTDPKKDNNTFGGWYENVSDESTKKDADSIFTANVTLTAKWVEDVTFTYDDNLGKNGPGKVKAPAGAVYTDPTTEPTRDNYTFDGWNTKSNGSGKTITADGVKTNADIAADGTTLYAQWTANGEDQVDLTFDANLEGVTPNPSVVTVNKGDNVYTVNVPEVSKDDYTFDGWYESASITDTTQIDFEAGYEVSEDKTVYAHWTYTGADAVTVTFKNGDATYGTATVAPNTVLGEMMPVDPIKEGFTFKEWNKAENGEGDSFTKTTDVGTTSFTVYAQYYSNITVKYDANGGTGAPASVTKSAADEYKDPDVSGMTKTAEGTAYKFVGWNTEKNGSGSYVKEGEILTYAQVAELFAADGTTPDTVTVYAQWARVPSVGAIGGDAPDSNGVRVTFDSNAYGTTAASVKDANPKYKYPVLGDTIGNDNMPTEPTRDNYTFDGWYLNKQCEGTEFTGATKVDTATLGDALKTVDGSTDKYEVTLYAKWTLKDDVAESDKVTVTFNKNSDGTGKAADDIKTVTLFKGDALGYDVDAPENKVTNGEYDFVGWYEGSVVDGKVTFNANKFAAETPINASTTYYAKWQMYLLAQVQPNMVEGTETDYTYTGKEIVPQYKVFQITYPDGTDKPYSIVDESSPIYTGDFSDSADFAVTYKKSGNPETLKNAGTYQIDVSFKAGSALKAAGADSIVIDAPTVEIKPAGLTFKVDPEKQVQKFGQVTLPTPESVEGIQNSEAEDLIYGNRYYKVGDTEITSAGDITEVGHYLWKIELKTENYIIANVISSEEGKDVLKYNITDGYTDFAGTNEGQNLVLDVIANDPSINEVTVESSQSGENKQTLTLKESDYTTNATFDNAEEPAKTDYFIRVTDTEADQVSFTFTLTNPDTTNLTASEGSTVTPNGDGTYTVVAPITNKGATTNTLTVTTKAGDKTLNYTFTIQQLVEAKITLNYGNSPYGEIMKDAKITDKAAAKAAFDVNNSFDDRYLPETVKDMHMNGSARIVYRPEVWTDAGVDNMDKNDTAIFVYNGKVFRDPGFEALNSLGQAVEDKDVTRVIKVNRMNLEGTKGAANVTDYDAEDAVATGSLLTFNGADVTNRYLFKNITSADSAVKKIRPGVYDMEYSFTDTATGDKVTTIRKVIVLFGTGDTDFSTDISPIDLNAIKSSVATNKNDIDGAPAITNSLYLHRIMDTDNSGDISPIDLNKIKSSVATSEAIPDYYIHLESE